MLCTPLMFSRVFFVTPMAVTFWIIQASSHYFYLFIRSCSFLGQSLFLSFRLSLLDRISTWTMLCSYGASYFKAYHGHLPFFYDANFNHQSRYDPVSSLCHYFLSPFFLITLQWKYFRTTQVSQWSRVFPLNLAFLDNFCLIQTLLWSLQDAKFFPSIISVGSQGSWHSISKRTLFSLKGMDIGMSSLIPSYISVVYNL